MPPRPALRHDQLGRVADQLGCARLCCTALGMHYLLANVVRRRRRRGLELQSQPRHHLARVAAPPIERVDGGGRATPPQPTRPARTVHRRAGRSAAGRGLAGAAAARVRSQGDAPRRDGRTVHRPRRGRPLLLRRAAGRRQRARASSARSICRPRRRRSSAYVADYPTNAEVIQPPLYHALLAPALPGRARRRRNAALPAAARLGCARRRWSSGWPT